MISFPNIFLTEMAIQIKTEVFLKANELQKVLQFVVDWSEKKLKTNITITTSCKPGSICNVTG